ncbi:ABC transporter substrate-binding protein [Desulfosediminicola flagellatus]|uniref:ABC transporter substrate-binding protein n=1 Tax=Desulfosediminicola flagellatus TaxID=2569541 RepID=UPI00142EFD38|nr:ABC transporter substrate-binding protein [Desulfosediminicola flagellatus]
MKSSFYRMIMVLLMMFVLVSCQSERDDTPADSPTSGKTTPLPIETALAPEGESPPPGFEDQQWADIVNMARGQTVNWYMWGGSQETNDWVTDYVGSRLRERYGITLNAVFSDIVDSVDTVRREHAAGQDTNGAVDLIWINGENYQAMRKEQLLYGPWSRYLPNTVFVDWNDEIIAKDFGLPVDGYESPYGKGQIVIAYDQAKVKSPPTTIPGLVEWIKANPGKFTYPALPDFTGTAFVCHICYWVAGKYQFFQEEYDQSIADQHLPACYDVLNEIEPFLWNQGKTYPASATEQEALFIAGEVLFDIDYQVANASRRVASGVYPPLTRTFVFESGTLADSHYVAIPYNSSSKAGAMVVANLLLSPEAQLDKITKWGDSPAVDPMLLPVEWRQKFNQLPRGVATLPSGILAEHRLPEPRPEWLEAIERGWVQHVLND